MYLVCDGPGVICRKMPWNLDVCPVCGQGIHFARGWTWINPVRLTGGKDPGVCSDCIFQTVQTIELAVSEAVGEGPEARAMPPCPFTLDRGGMLWVGATFYTPESFMLEAMKMGVSKRIWAIPRGFKLGKTWVFTAHKKAGRKELCALTKGSRCGLDGRACAGDDKGCPNARMVIKEVPALFYAFRPTRVELLIWESALKGLLPEEVEAFKQKGITLVPVPDGDTDHSTDVYAQAKLKATLKKSAEKAQKKARDVPDEAAELEQEKAEVAAYKADQMHQDGVDD